MAPQPTIATKFLVLSDTHNFECGDTVQSSPPWQPPTSKVDVLLHCGDLTQVGGVSSFKKALRMLGGIEAELKLVIAGNHDLELDKAYWEAQRDYEGNPEDPEDHDLAIEIMTGPLAREAGVTFLREGTHFFNLKNGSSFKIYVSPYTPAFGDWAFAYEPNEDRFNKQNLTAGCRTSTAANPIPYDASIVMTHGPPKGILDLCPQGNVGCDNLLRAIQRVKPLMHCFGHIHESSGIEIIDWKKNAKEITSVQKNAAMQRRFEEDPKENPYPQSFAWKDDIENRTLAVNAAIMTGNNHPDNAPWLISLDLPRAM